MSAAKDKWVNEQLAARGLKDTATNKKTLGKQYDSIFLGGSPKDWRTFFKQQFPQLATMVDGGAGEAEARQIFGDLIDLFIDVANNPDNYDLTSTAGQAAFKNKVESTKYAQNTTAARAAWDAKDPVEKQDALKTKRDELRGSFAGLGLTMTELDNLALQALRDNRNDLEIKYMAFGKLADRPTGGLLETSEATTLKAALKMYDFQPKDVDDLISAALTGQVVAGVPQTSELLLNKAKLLAKQKYRAFAEQFDQGLTVQDVFEPYRDIAARVLDRSPNDISMSNPLYRKPLETVKDNNLPMTLGEWTKELKTNNDYGWRFTNQANQQVSSVVSTLERAFGLIK
jgi:hypothetical protein